MTTGRINQVTVVCICFCCEECGLFRHKQQQKQSQWFIVCIVWVLIKQTNNNSLMKLQYKWYITNLSQVTNDNLSILKVRCLYHNAFYTSEQVQNTVQQDDIVTNKLWGFFVLFLIHLTWCPFCCLSENERNEWILFMGCNHK